MAWRIQQFAKLAGVTVRTLHFYDQKGLLSPQQRTNSGYRVYQQADLIRLQQILTLKALGFSLEMIGEMLTDKAYSLPEALQLQMQGLAQRIAQLQIAHYSLSRMLDTLNTAGTIDWEQVTVILQSFAELSQTDLVNRYYTPEQQAWMHERSIYTPPEVITEGARAWREITADFERRRHLPPDHPEIQAIVGRMEQLVGLFTGGDASIAQAHERHHQETEHRLPSAFRMTNDPALGAFIGEAVKIYKERQQS
jgi:DNA-binding transcriptional MerR regulator